VKEVKAQSNLEIRDCGLMAYREALSLQQDLVKQRQKDQICNTVLILEHPPVITLGVRKDLNELLVAEEILKQREIELVKVRRGGGCTAHNPGQVILYPIIKLPSLALGVNDYIKDLEAVGIELLEQLGVTAERRKHLPGLWIGQRKIGSIGVRITRQVTYHGMAINIKNDLSIFETIVPCGLKSVRITNLLKETSAEYSMDQIKQKLARLCVKHWANQNGELVSG
jgi:lipoate-protein ligase B